MCETLIQVKSRDSDQGLRDEKCGNVALETHEGLGRVGGLDLVESIEHADHFLAVLGQDVLAHLLYVLGRKLKELYSLILLH